MSKRPPSEILRKMAAEVDRVLTGNDFDFLLDEIPEKIKTRTRLGKGVTDGKEIVGLAPLTENYIKKREDSRGELSNVTKPKRSNLTFTGQLLEAIDGVKLSTGKMIKFVFTFKENRRDEASNKAIVRAQATMGRRFFDLAKSEKAFFERKIAKVIREKIRKKFNF